MNDTWDRDVGWGRRRRKFSAAASLPIDLAKGMLVGCWVQHDAADVHACTYAHTRLHFVVKTLS